MGTLTADQARLPGFCDHKLPTSCRLSSIGECCACYDERGHSATYTVYVDGVGLVSRGTRWQRYCWFCKEFWQNRVAASGLSPTQTRIPERPDQTEFLERWYDFHRGYRIVTKDDGSEERVSVLGEHFKDVSPGYLPRTLEELRAGRERNAFETAERERQALEAEEQAPSGPSLDETLDQMFEAAAAEEDQSAPQNELSPATPWASTWSVGIHGQVMAAAGSRNREYQARRVAALRRELYRMRNGIERVISGLRELGENVPDQTEATTRLTDLGRTLDTISGIAPSGNATRGISTNSLAEGATSHADRAAINIQARVNEARQHMDEARRSRDQAASELDVAEQEFRSSQQRLQRMQQEQRTADNYTRIFGTREEMQAQGEDYVSPISNMFARAYDRFHAAEDVRREERTLRQVLDDESRGGAETVRRLSELQARDRDVWGVPRPRTQEQHLPSVADLSLDRTQSDNGEIPGQTSSEEALSEYYNLLRTQTENQQASGSFLSGLESSLPSSREIPAAFPYNIARPEVESRLTRLVEPIPAPWDSTLEERIREDRTVIDAGTLETEQMVTLLRMLRLNHNPTSEMEESDFLIIAMVSREDVRVAAGWNIDEVRRILQARLTHLTPADWATLAGIRGNDDLVWAAGLPARRVAYLRSTPGGLPSPITAQRYNSSAVFTQTQIEYVIETFQMSAEMRSHSNLSTSEQLHMRDRFQNGERTAEDRQVILDLMRTCDNLAELVYSVHDAVERRDVSANPERRSELEAQDRRSALGGGHSREELDAQRRATHAFATAAGRLAMQTGPAALLERMAERDPETRAAYQRLQANWLANGGQQATPERIFRPLSLEDYSPALDSDTEEEEEDQEQGLDAPDSGRPEPKTDEEMNVPMECKICFTQLAEIACLPCGHLVMCRWCSDQHSPVMQHDRTRPRRAAGCPMCRKGIRQKVRVYRA